MVVGYIMFNNSHGAYVDRVLVPYAQEIAKADVEEMPQYSWGSAVLAATYRGLCKASVQNKHNAILTGCLIATALVVREDSNWSPDCRPLTV